jgi:hypothetical protein
MWVYVTLINLLQHCTEYSSGFASQEGEIYIKYPSVLSELLKVLVVASCVTQLMSL